MRRLYCKAKGLPVCIVFGVVFGVLGLPAAAQAPAQSGPATPGPAIDQVIANQDYLKLCAIEPQLNFFQHICQQRHADKAQEIKDAWLVFTIRNRDNLRQVRQACVSSRRWPALGQKLRQDEKKAVAEWLKKPLEEVNAFCDKMPASLQDTAIEQFFVRAVDRLGNAPPPSPAARKPGE